MQSMTHSKKKRKPDPKKNSVNGFIHFQDTPVTRRKLETIMHLEHIENFSYLMRLATAFLIETYETTNKLPVLKDPNTIKRTQGPNRTFTEPLK